jgi:hypothetical protein
LLFLASISAIFAAGDWRPEFDVPAYGRLAAVQGKLHSVSRPRGIGLKYVIQEDNGTIHTFDCERRKAIYCQQTANIEKADGEQVVARFDKTHPSWLISVTTTKDNKEVYSYKESKRFYSSNTGEKTYISLSVIFSLLYIIALCRARKKDAIHSS